jgi:hypothetical protein
MISEILPELYDVSGKKVTKPTTKKHKRLFPSTYPMGRYLSHPLAVKCHDFEELRQFLRECSYISDQEQFNKEDHWMPPEEFEKRQQGDCDDFSLWAWRQLIEMGYSTRLVIGRSGKYGAAHAWVTYQDNNKHFLLEPLLSATKKMPQLSTVRYKPKFSCEWDGKKLSYFVHDNRPFNINIFKLSKLSVAWLSFWCCFWVSRIFLLVVSAPVLVGIKVFHPFKNTEQKPKFRRLATLHHYFSAILFFTLSIIVASVLGNSIEIATGFDFAGTIFFFASLLFISLFTDIFFVRLKNRFKYVCIILVLLTFYYFVQ